MEHNRAQHPASLIRRPQVSALTGLQKSHLYALIKARSFPQPVKLGERAVAWVETEVRQWVAGRIAARAPEAR